MSGASGVQGGGHIGEQLLQVNALSPVAVTANGVGVAVDRQGYNAIFFSINVGAVTGTTPTLDIKVTEADTSGGTYTDAVVGQFGTVTLAQLAAADADTAKRLILDCRKLKRFLKLSNTVGGTTPSFLVGATAVMGATDFLPAA